MKKLIYRNFEINIIPYLNALGVEVNEFNPGSYRMTSETKTIDYYPKSRKIYNHQSQQWSKAKGLRDLDLMDSLGEHLEVNV